MFSKLICFLVITLLLSLNSCTAKKPNNNLSGSKINNSTKAYSETKVIYSKNFSIEYTNDYKIINIFSADEKHKLIFQYLLLPKDSPIPNGYSQAMIVRIPINSIISLSSLYIGFLERLGLLDKLIAVDKFQYVSSPKVWSLIDSGKIYEVGESYNLNIEEIYKLKPGLILTYGNGNPFVDANPKLIEFGIKVASTTIHLETTPLARAEWIKFIAAFFNYESKANKIFDSLALKYNKLVSMTKNIENRPTVFTEALVGGIWFEPGGKSFMANLLKDAGADYIWKDDNSTGSLRLTYEQVFAKAHNADFWVNVLFWSKFSDALKNDPRNAKFKAYQAKNIYNYNRLVNKYGFYQYWEDSVVNCDILLSDLIKIFHPELLPGYKLFYYKRLENK
ncbi:ABC transporter substrate-binding protein [Melioribacteraceae bacterium 4301-Me]|uniref:ABC transporter substrate-binding protein n=1 Tax=Pyranulibacter aquaticus TaxID=3163344 RepID=UPI00359786C1